MELLHGRRESLGTRSELAIFRVELPTTMYVQLMSVTKSMQICAGAQTNKPFKCTIERGEE